MSARVRLPARWPDLAAVADDHALLARFAADRDDAAFAALVRRHGPMVLGVCRRVVRDAHLADDAFQATFVVLARRPDAVRASASVASWLFGVARRVALAAKRRDTRLRRRDAITSTLPPADCPLTPDWDDLLRVLDEELARLPDDLRAPLIACHLDGHTQDEAARSLGWSLSTLRRRLDRGRELLRERLTRRGATLSAGLFAGVVAPSASAAVPNRLVAAAVTAARGPTPGPLAFLAAAGAKGRGFTLSFGGTLAVGVVLVGGVVAAAAWPDVPALAISQAVAPTPRAEWVTVRGRVLFPAGRPTPIPSLVSEVKHDAAVVLSNGPVVDESLLVNPKNRGIANVLVWLRPADGKTFPADRVHPDLRTARPAVRAVETAAGQFRPRVTAARAGDRLRFVNPAPIPHNVNYAAPGRDDPFNVIVPAGQAFDAPRPLAARPADRAGAATFRDNIHPWMRGAVRAFDHPYFAVTDADGRFAIPLAPAGPARIAYWHEGGFPTGKGGRDGVPLTIPGDADGVTLPPLEFAFPAGE